MKLLTGLVFLLFLSACSRANPCSLTDSSGHTTLLFGLESHSTRLSVAKEIGTTASPEMLYCSSPSQVEYRYRFSTQMGGVSGDGELVFFGQRLMSTVFYPSDTDAFRAEGLELHRDHDGQVFVEKTNASIMKEFREFVFSRG